jgi:two-component system LytT family response regulator
MHLRSIAPARDLDVLDLADAVEALQGLVRRLETAVTAQSATSSPPRRLAIRSGGHILLVSPSEIEWVEAARNYVRLHFGDSSHLLRETMTGVEVKLPKECFVRIHRSIIVNAEAVREIAPRPHGDFLVVVKSGKELPMSRGFREKLGQALRIQL